LNQNEFKCKWLKPDEIWDSAENIRTEYCPAGKLPIDVERIVEFDLGLDIEPMHDLLREADMDAYLRSDLTGIIVDYDRYMEARFANRMRFSFAHELGHLYLHKNLYASISFNSAEEWHDILQSLPESEYKNFEYQANEFAGRLLVPRNELFNELEISLEIIKQNHHLLDYLKVDPESVLSGISPQLARPFGVSTDVVETRVKREKLWPPNL
jgi:hypothetical protein